MAAEKVQFVAQYGHSVGVASHRDHSLDLRLDPGHGVEIKNIDIIKALISVVPSEHVQLAADTRHRVTCSR